MIDAGTGTAENYPVFSVAGGRARNQNFTLDGGNVSNAVGLTRPQQLTSLPVDAMQEFRVISNNYSAEYGHSTGGVVVMSTRSGTNDFHGSLFESLQNNVLNARNFFAASRPASRLNQFGATLGGPIKKDRLWFFYLSRTYGNSTSVTGMFANKNAGNPNAWTYVPEGLPKGAPLVVVLHGCTQNARGYDHGSGWSAAAEEHGFAVLFPEQQRANNPNLCFNWYRPQDAR